MKLLPSVIGSSQGHVSVKFSGFQSQAVFAADSNMGVTILSYGFKSGSGHWELSSQAIPFLYAHPVILTAICSRTESLGHHWKEQARFDWSEQVIITFQFLLVRTLSGMFIVFRLVIWRFIRKYDCMLDLTCITHISSMKIWSNPQQ